MTDDDGSARTVRVEADASGLVEAAALVERAFDRSMDAVANTIGRAARSGETSFHGMVNAIVADLSRIAVQSFIVQPLEGLLKGVFNFGGARAAGGPVAPGQSYLVGENGPELFTPAGHGAIAANGAMGGGRGVVINVTTPDVAGFARSEAQLGAMLSRAVARGQRRL